MPSEKLIAKGHHNVRATHRNTLEVTKEPHLTPRGDCIIAVSSDKSMADLSDEFKTALRREDAVLKITIECGSLKDSLKAYGHPNLILDHPTDFVIRKTNFICPRTLAVNADKAALDLDRTLVKKLMDYPEVIIKLEVI